MAVTVTNDASTFRRTANMPGLGAFSLFGWFKFSSVTPGRFWAPFGLVSAVDGASGRFISSIASGSAQLAIGYTDSGGGFDYNALFTVSANTWYFIALTSSGNAIGNLTGYIRARTDNAFTKVSNAAALNSFTPGAIDFGRDGFTGEYMSGDMHGIGVADVALSEDELLRLSYFHEAHLRGIRSLNCYFPGIASVNSNLTVDRSGNGRNATSTVGALADGPPILWRALSAVPQTPITSSGAIAGNISLALAPSGTIAGAGAIAGSATLALSPSGNLTAGGALSGTSTLTLSPSGTITGAGAIAGTAAVTLSPSGTLEAAGAMSGSAALTFSPSGTASAAGALAGSMTLTLAPSGAVTGAGGLAGNATLTLSPSGSLAGAGAMSGSVALTLTFDGNLAPADSLHGTIVLALSPSGTASGAGAMSGSAALTLAPAGTLAGLAFLGGSTSLTFGASGQLEEPSSELAGSIAVSIGGAASLSADAALAGSSSIVVTFAGRLVKPCEDLVVNKKDPNTDDLVAVAFLDRYERYAKASEDIAIVRLFYLSIYCEPVFDLTRAEYSALTRAKRIELMNAPSTAGLVDTDGKSNA